MKFASLAFAVITLGPGLLPAHEIQSPDGKLVVSLELDQGELLYDINYEGFTAIERSPLGLETSIGSFAAELREVGVEKGTIDERYELPHGKTSDVRYVANELTASYENANGDRLEVVFRVSDNDVAFRYGISGEDKRRIVVERETTGFNLPDDATAFVTPQVPWGGGYMSTKPSYEEGYLMDIPVSEQSHTGLGFTFPALFRLGDNGWALISETGVSSKYAGSRLSDPDTDGLYTIAFPEPEENGGVGDATVAAALPLATPWRTITVGETLAPVVETTVATDVVKPLYEPSKQYKPGRASWSWLLWQDGSMNYEDQQAFIDLASELDFEYILVDAWWDAQIGRERIVDLVEYARSKDVGVLLWYNSNGYWNDAPQTPRNRMHTAPLRQAEMAWLQSIGVEGLKVDFFGGDKQTTMKYYEDLMTDANRYGLSLNFHGATLPRGWERMYPNHMTSEAVTASENLVFSQGFADQEAFNSTVYPFVRNPVAAMDYGPLVLNPRFSKEPNSGNVRRTTDAFQLATSVLYFSPIQHFGLTPNNLEEQPEFVLDFLRDVPAAWDETRYLAGYPGKYVVLARRSGEHWYIAATNGGDEEREIAFEAPFLAGRKLSLIHDKGEGKEAALREIKVESDGRVTLDIAPGGGAVLYQR